MRICVTIPKGYPELKSLLEDVEGRGGRGERLVFLANLGIPAFRTMFSGQPPPAHLPAASAPELPSCMEASAVGKLSPLRGLKSIG